MKTEEAHQVATLTIQLKQFSFELVSRPATQQRNQFLGFNSIFSTIEPPPKHKMLMTYMEFVGSLHRCLFL